MQLKTIVMILIVGLSPLANGKPQSISQEMRMLKDNADKEISIPVSNGIKINGLLSKTSKGNGTLLLGDYALLRIYDAHSDGYYYADNVLNVELQDITGNNLNELIITGVAIHTDEKEVILGYEQIIYIFCFKDGRFNLMYQKSPIEIDLAK